MHQVFRRNMVLSSSSSSSSSVIWPCQKWLTLSLSHEQLFIPLRKVPFTNKMIVSFQSWVAMKCDAIPLTLHVLLLKSILHPTTCNNTFLLYFLSLVGDVNVRHVFKKTIKYYRNNINVLATCFIVEFNKLYSAIVYIEFCC